MPRLILAATAVLAAVALAGCAPEDPTTGWDEPANYTMVVEYDAADPDAGTFEVIVEDHEVVGFERVDARGPILEGERFPQQDYSLRQIIGLYKAALADRESEESVRFDANGIPVEVEIRWHPDSPLDTQRWVVHEFTAH